MVLNVPNFKEILATYIPYPWELRSVSYNNRVLELIIVKFTKYNRIEIDIRLDLEYNALALRCNDETPIYITEEVFKLPKKDIELEEFIKIIINHCENRLNSTIFAKKGGK